MNNNKEHTARLIGDALLNSKAGQAMLAQVKVQKDVRHKELTALVAKVFPEYFGKLQRVQMNVLLIASNGGQQYDATVKLVKDAKNSELDWDIARRRLIA